MIPKPFRRTWRRFYHNHGEAMRLTLIGAVAIMGGLMVAKKFI